MSSASYSTIDHSAQILDIVDLTFTHMGQTQPTLQNIHLTLNVGELVLLAGSTGSGKSTLLNCLTGISPEHTGGTLSGHIHYRGENMVPWSIRQRSQVMGILLQNVETQLFTDQVWEEVVFGLENWNVLPDEIHVLAHSALAEFDLLMQQQWKICQLSAGQKQRLLLACLLTRQPDMLLLDEPFAFLDSAGVRLLLQLLQKRVQHGQTVLLIEHRLELLQGMCDRAYRIEAGCVRPMDISELKASATLPVPFLTNPPDNFQHSTRQSMANSCADPTCPDQDKVVLQTHNLSWGGYPPFPELRVCTGEIVLLRGENGCGKTTLLNLISGLLKPSTGYLEIQGRDTTRQSVVQIAQTVGFVLQNPNHQLFADSVRAEIMQPGVPLARANQLLEQLNLSHCAEQHPHALSQGQKRRLALGAVLARHPQICLLDEIMVGQDATSLDLMLKALKTFTDNGGTLIFTSHDPGIASVLNPNIITIKSLAD